MPRNVILGNCIHFEYRVTRSLITNRSGCRTDDRESESQRFVNALQVLSLLTEDSKKVKLYELKISMQERKWLIC